MNTPKSILLFITVISVLLINILPVNAYGSSTPTSSRQGITFNEIDAYIGNKLREWNVPGASLAIVENGRIVHTQGFGSNGKDGGKPSPQSPFMIGSLTKSFTALGVMQLVEEGKVELDAPIKTYLPWFTLAETGAAEKITIRQLLNQTSGLPQLRGMQLLADFDTSPTATEIQSRGLSDLQPARPAGSGWEYSNLNFNLLGLVVEAASGEKYADYVQNHIFIPLTMNHSFSSKADAQVDGLVPGNQMWFGFPVGVPDMPVPEGSLPSGQLISSAEDLSHYMIAQLNGGTFNGKEILSTEGTAEMHKPAAGVNVMENDMGDYGMGWFIKDTENGPLVYHYGEVPDYFAYMALLPEQNRGIAILINANQQLYTFASLEMGEAAAKMLAGEPPVSDSWWVLPWALRAMLLLPVIQLFAIWATSRRIDQWKQNPAKMPGKFRLWVLHILPAVILNLIPIIGALLLLFSGLLKFLMLFMGDMVSVILLCGLISLVWLPLRAVKMSGVIHSQAA